MSKLIAVLVLGVLVVGASILTQAVARASSSPQTGSSVVNPSGSPIGNPGALEIDPSIFDKVVAISDIHGMYQPFHQLLLQGKLLDSQDHWTGGKTLLIVVGDSIDKGPQSLEVMDLLIRLQSDSTQSGGRVAVLLGNHEAEFLADPENKKAAELLNELEEKQIPISDLTSDSTTYGKFLHSEPLALKVGGWLFAHAGAYSATSWSDFGVQASRLLNSRDYSNEALIGDDSILENREWYRTAGGRSSELATLSHSGFWGLVFGHQPTAFGIAGRSAAVEGGRIIKIDNGMPPEAGTHAGSLLVFEYPKQMLLSQFPDVSVIKPDGSRAKMQPEDPLCLEDDILKHCKYDQ